MALLLLAAALLPSRSDAVELDGLSPRILASVPKSLSHRLKAAFDLALERVEEEPGCRDLFTGLSRDAREALSGSIYTQASVTHEKDHCRSAAALTAVGHPVTFVCRSFGRLSEQRAAATLIHEALHHAGMPESPADPTALDSREINALVANHCRL